MDEFNLMLFDTAFNLLEIVTNKIDNKQFDSIKHICKIENFNESFSFTSKYSKNIKELNYVGFFDLKNDLKIFQIAKIENNFKDKTQVVSCESISLLLINKVFDSYSATEQLGISKYFEMFLDDSMFKIRTNEVAHNVRTLNWESEGTALNRILSVASSFDVELKFSANYNKMLKKVDFFYIDIFKKLGKDTNRTLKINKGLSDIVKKIDTTTLKTSILAKGATLEDKEVTVTEKSSDGLNLIKNSVGIYENLNWTINSNAIPKYTYEPSDTLKSGSGWYLKDRAEIRQEILVKANTLYTISYYSKSTGGNDNKIFIDLGGKAVFADLFKKTDDYVKVSFTFNTNNYTKFAVGFWVADGSTTYVTDLMISEGSVALEWSEHESEVTETTHTEKIGGTVNIEDIEYDDGEFRTEKGSRRIYAYKANEKYRQNFKTINSGYIDGIYSYETESSEELFNRALNQLKILSEPAVEYVADINTISEMIDLYELNLGDYINISDSLSDVDLNVKARIVEINYDYLNTQNNKIILGNYYQTRTNLSKSFKELRDLIFKNKANWSAETKVLTIENSTTDTFLNDNIEAVLTAKLLSGATDITNTFAESKFKWTKYDENNVIDQSWTENHQKTVKVTLDNSERIKGFATYKVEIEGTDYVAIIKINNISTTIASKTEPLYPNVGQQWLDISKNPATLYMYTANGWLNISEMNLDENTLNKLITDVTNTLTPVLNGKENAIFKQNTAPLYPANGVLWVDTSKEPNIVYRYDSALNNWFKLSASEASEILLASGETLADELVRIKQEISEDSIISTVLASKSFNDLLYQNEANSEATKQELLTQIQQLADKFNFSVANSGGINLLQNSLGFAGRRYWNFSTKNDFYQQFTSQEIKNIGFYSGFKVNQNMYSSWNMYQTVPVLPNTTYSISFYAKKDTGPADHNIFVEEQGLELKQIYKLNANNMTSSFKKYTYTFKTSFDAKFLNIKIKTGWSDYSENWMYITGLMLNAGSPLEWQQYKTEFYNTNVIIDLNGISILSSQNERYVQITNDSFEIYREVDGIVKKVLSVNSDLTEISKLSISEEIILNNISLKKISTNSNKGFGFFRLPK